MSPLRGSLVYVLTGSFFFFFFLARTCYKLFLSWFTGTLRLSCKWKSHSGALMIKFRKALIQKPPIRNGETHQALDNAQTAGNWERLCNQICSRTVAYE